MKPKKTLPETPKVENKYALTLKKVRAMAIDWNKVGKTDSHWWRNDIIKAWCLSKGVGTKEDMKYGTDDGYHIAFYDEGAAKKRFKISCSAYGGMCGYEFNEFYKPSDIDNITDLRLQEQLLTELNKLIDDGVLFETESLDEEPNNKEETWRI